MVCILSQLLGKGPIFSSLHAWPLAVISYLQDQDPSLANQITPFISFVIDQEIWNYTMLSHWETPLWILLVVPANSLPQHLWGPLWWLGGKESTCQCRRVRFDPWIGKIPWRRKWQPTPVFLPGKSHGQGSLGSYSPWGCRVRHYLAI